MSRVVGVDPGITGAIALLVDGSLQAVSEMPCFDGEANGRLIALLLEQLEPDVVVIEHVQPMPKNGTIASFSLGKNYGIVIGVASSLQHPLVKIRPMDWKKTNGLLKQPKAASRKLAAELWPHMAHRFARVKDDGLAEAALIARAHNYRTLHQHAS